jgi:hypothetical protein
LSASKEELASPYSEIRGVVRGEEFMEIVLTGYLIMQAAVFTVVGIEYWKDCVRTRKPGSKPMR